VRKTFNHIVVLLFILLVTANMNAAPHDSNQNSTAHFRGIVEHKDEGRIEGASIIFRSETGETRKLSSNAVGEVELELTAGLYTVVVEKPGFLKLVVKDLLVEDGAQIVRPFRLKKEGEKRVRTKVSAHASERGLINGAPNNSFNRSGNSSYVIDNLDAARQFFPPG